jgi:hypothetical protein
VIVVEVLSRVSGTDVATKDAPLSVSSVTTHTTHVMTASSLPLDDYKRYGRQMILDGIGLPGTSTCIVSTREWDEHPAQVK